MPKVRVTAQWWNEPVGGGFVRHEQGSVVEVSGSEADRLSRAGAALVVQEPKPKPRRKPVDE